MISRLRHDMTEVSSALQTVTIAMGFLAGETSQPDMPLGQYVLRVLKIKRKLEFCRKVCFSTSNILLYSISKAFVLIHFEVIILVSISKRIYVDLLIFCLNLPITF